MHLANYTCDQTRCAADQFINCAEFDELHNIWSIAQRTCNRVRIRARVRDRVWVRVSFRVKVRLGLGLRNWPNAQGV